MYKKPATSISINRARQFSILFLPRKMSKSLISLSHFMDIFPCSYGTTLFVKGIYELFGQTNTHRFSLSGPSSLYYPAKSQRLLAFCIYLHGDLVTGDADPLAST